VLSRVIAAVTLYGRFVWPQIGRHTLTSHEQEAFKRAIRGKQSPEKVIQIACPPSDETDCVFAAQFLPLFGSEDWKVQGAIERATLIRPMVGVVLVQHGGTKAGQLNWNAGGFTEMSPTLEHVRQAFVNVGIQLDSSAGFDIPDGQITAYFGPEKPDESVPTTLTNQVRQIEEMRRNGKLPPSGAK
jgi:hypothetical protein